MITRCEQEFVCHIELTGTRFFAPHAGVPLCYELQLKVRKGLCSEEEALCARVRVRVRMCRTCVCMSVSCWKGEKEEGGRNSNLACKEN